jgi:putative methyltransferase
MTLSLRPVPHVKKIVYSTCSIHAIENEGIVKHVLNSVECKTGGFRLAPRNEVLSSWPRRGLPEELDTLGEFFRPYPSPKSNEYFPDAADSLVRCLPGEDATNGFFVSCFVKEDEMTTGKRKFVDNDSPVPHHKRKKPRGKSHAKANQSGD